MENKITIYYNPECSKCQTALCSIEERGLQTEIIEYLKDSPTEEDIAGLLKKLGIPARELVRVSEPLFQEMFKDANLTESEWIGVMAKYPILIQRPIIIRGDKAVLGRSKDQLDSIL